MARVCFPATLSFTAIVLALVACAHAVPTNSSIVPASDFPAVVEAVHASPLRKRNGHPDLPPVELLARAGPEGEAAFQVWWDELVEGAHKSDHFQKRGVVTRWIDRKIVGPLVDRTRPLIYHVLDVSINSTATVISEYLPKGLRDTVQEVLQLKESAPHKPPNCMYGLQTICNKVVSNFRKFTDGVKDSVSRLVVTNLSHQKEEITKLIIVTLKNELFFSEEARRALIKRGLRSWYVGKVNSVMQKVFVALQPKLRDEIFKAIPLIVKELPWLPDWVDTILLEDVKKPEEAVPRSYVGKRGLWQSTKDKYNSFTDYVSRKFDATKKAVGRKWDQFTNSLDGRIKALKQGIKDKVVVIIQTVLGEVENIVLKVTIRVAEHLVADALPFFSKEDSDFTPLSLPHLRKPVD